MQDLPPELQRGLDEAARRHGVSFGAAQAVLAALRSGGGAMAQFNHPELGGMGQWSRGGMVMVGDMFNAGLKARVDALCSDVAALLRDQPPEPSGSGQASSSGGWWPDGLGTPSASGAQNSMRYAYFPGARRLAVQQDGRLSLYDTGDHRISGVSQQQGGAQSLSFTSQHGPVSLDSLLPAEPDTGEAAPGGAAAPAGAPAPGGADDPLSKIERLAELRQKGILTEEEFAAAKADLLRRL